MKFPKSDDTMVVGKEMVDYYLKMGYTLAEKFDTAKVIKLNPKKDKDKPPIKVINKIDKRISNPGIENGR